MQRQKTPAELVGALRKWHALSGYSYEEIAVKSDVDLSTVYRIFDENAVPEKRGSGIKKICKIAKISLEAPPPSGRLPKVLNEALLAVWDGSNGHAQRLATAITAIGKLDRRQLSSGREKR